MEIYSSLFGGKKKSSAGLPPEVTQIFEKIAELMGNENLQNSMNLPMIKEQIVGALNMDQLPHGIGEFGRVAETQPLSTAHSVSWCTCRNSKRRTPTRGCCSIGWDRLSRSICTRRCPSMGASGTYCSSPCTNQESRARHPLATRLPNLEASLCYTERTEGYKGFPTVCRRRSDKPPRR